MDVECSMEAQEVLLVMEQEYNLATVLPMEEEVETGGELESPEDQDIGDEDTEEVDEAKPLPPSGPTLVVGKRANRQQDEEDMVMRTEPRKKKKSLDFIKNILAFAFSQVGVILLCIFYAVLGANYYLALERPGEEDSYRSKQEVAKEIIAAHEYLAENYWFLIKTDNEDRRLNQSEFYEKVESDLRSHIHKMVEAAANQGYDGEVEGWTYAWTFPNSLLFTITIMTTIGYGHISPQTDAGKLFTIVYAMVGMPLFVMFIGGIGNTMANAIQYGYSRICCRWCRIQRLVSERLPGQSLRKARRLRDEKFNEETYMPSNEIVTPIILSIMTIVIYLGLGSAIFTQWEEWDLVAAAYFCFITLSTVGFGDMVPKKSFLGYEESLYGKFKMLVCITYCAMGLALLAMCMSLIQEGLAIKAEKMKKKLTGGKAKVDIDIIEAKSERARFDSANGVFVGVVPDTEDPVDTFSIAETEATEVEDDINSTVEEEVEEEEQGVADEEAPEVNGGDDENIGKGDAEPLLEEENDGDGEEDKSDM